MVQEKATDGVVATEGAGMSERASGAGRDARGTNDRDTHTHTHTHTERERER